MNTSIQPKSKLIIDSTRFLQSRPHARTASFADISRVVSFRLMAPSATHPKHRLWTHRLVKAVTSVSSVVPRLTTDDVPLNASGKYANNTVPATWQHRRLIMPILQDLPFPTLLLIGEFLTDGRRFLELFTASS